MRNLEKLSSER